MKYKNLLGTILTKFKIGKSGPILKNNSSILEIRNTSDSAFQVLRCSDPIGNDDAVTLRHYNANLGNVDRVIVEFVLNNTLPSIATAVDGYRIAPFAGVIEGIFVSLTQRGSNTNSPTTLDINKATPPAFVQGTAVFNFAFTTIYTTQANRPQLAGLTGSTTQNAFLHALQPDITTFNKGDLFSLDIDQRANSSDDLTVIMVLRKT